MIVIGLDIGGANIKIADADGNTASRSLAMWKHHAQLPSALTEMVAEKFGAPDLIGLTMTAELADCFSTKADGVAYVINCVREAFPKAVLRTWLTSGEFAEPEDAQELPELVAAANWHAQATWAARCVPHAPAILIDVGSTTTDIIPLLDGMPIPEGRSDVARLLSGELVYSGWLRTPVCAVVQTVQINDRTCPVAAELFATTADAWLVAGLIDERPDCDNTADGRPLVLAHSLNRLAHMLCCDATEISECTLGEIAGQIVAAQCSQIRDAFTKVLTLLEQNLNEQQRSLKSERPIVLISGSGAFVAERVLDEFFAEATGDRMVLSQMFYRPIAEHACAFAVARLAHDLCRDDLLEEVPFV